MSTIYFFFFSSRRRHTRFKCDWSSDVCSSDLRQKIPAFIITLGGLLIFKGLFWLVIHNSTIPIVQGGRANLYSVLTTFYLPPIVGYALAAVIIGFLIFAQVRSRKARKGYGFAVEDREVVFLKLFLAAQLIFLFVLVTNKFRGIPL